jgi:DnaJ-class molecular chaperone
VIVTEKMVVEAWDLLRTYARLVDERWDDAVMASVAGKSEVDVRSIFHHASKHTHPDMGGSTEKFAAVDRAKHILLEWLKRSSGAPAPAIHGPTRKCHMCDGKGFVTQQRGFRALRINCGACRGSGDLDTEHDHGDGR